MRIDAHVHFWRPSCGFDNRPIADHEAYRRDFLPGHIRPALDAGRIDGIVLVQTAPQVEETAWLLDVAQGHPWILGVTGWADLDSGRDALATLIAQPRIVGIRAQLRRVEDSGFVRRPRVVHHLAAALQAGLGVTMLAEHRHYEPVADVLDRLPAGPITFNHLGMRFPDVPQDAWRAAMRRFAQRPETYLQLSGLPFLFGDRRHEAAAHAVLDDALDTFGPQRLLFASDWPMMLRFASYAEWLGTVEAFLRRRMLTDAEVGAVFGGNALRANPRLQTAMQAQAD